MIPLYTIHEILSKKCIIAFYPSFGEHHCMQKKDILQVIVPILLMISNNLGKHGLQCAIKLTSPLDHFLVDDRQWSVYAVFPIITLLLQSPD